jgi:hypothetical protein
MRISALAGTSGKQGAPKPQLNTRNNHKKTLKSGPQCADESAATAPLGVLETTDSQKKYL